MDDEMRFHVDMEAERLMRERGLEAAEARRQAFVLFGGVEKFKEEGRDTRGVQWLDAIRQDSRIAARMLIKYPALTMIGGFSMAVAIAIGSLTFVGVSEALRTFIPIGGDRLIAIQFATEAQGQPDRKVLNDFFEWRDSLSTVRQLSAFRNVSHNLTGEGRLPETIQVGEVTASTFVVSNIPPHLGRTLQPQDESIGAPPVIVLGYDAWQQRFAGDAAIVGRTVTLGDVAHTIVGVMPEGFRFPVSHEYWTPLRFSAAEFGRLQGPNVFVFGKLAPEATLEQASAELAAVGQRTAAAYPELYSRLRLIALPYTREHLEIDRPEVVWLLRTVQLLIGGLLVIVAANLSILMYARTVTRLGEIAVRSALGASRARLLTQLFIEALALSLIGAIAGLVIAKAMLDVVIRPALIASGDMIPFWVSVDLTPGAVAYAIGLAILAALIVGVLPGLRTTGRQTHTNLRALGGGTGKPLGWLWTSLIVAQVAIAAAILPLSLYFVGEAARLELERPGFAVDEFLLAMVEDGRHQHEIVTRLQQEPGIHQVSFSSGVPGYEGSRYVRFEDASADVAAALDNVNTLEVGAGLFGVYEASLLAGRDFTSADIGSTNVIVNRTMADILARDGAALGRQFTFVGRAAEKDAPPKTYQIVGIVEDFPKMPIRPHSDAARMVYHATDLDARVWLTIRYRTAITAAGVDSVRRAVAEVDAAAPLRLTTLAEFYRVNRSPFRWTATGITLITLSVLLLSAAGLYALMSFTVAQRTREIGIRSALGVNPRRLLAGIFGRVLAQVSIGLALGSLLSGALIWSALEWREAVNVTVAVAAVILIVGLVAAIGPARRGLRIDPTEALRLDT